MSIFNSFKTFSDAEIVEILEAFPEKEDQVFKFFYRKHYSNIRGFLKTRGASDAQVDDIFQETLISFYRQVKLKKFELTAKISTYLHTIALNRWKNISNKNRRIRSIQNSDNVLEANISTIESQLDAKQKAEFIQILLAQLSPDCRKILELFYYQKMSMEDIAEEMSFKNAQISRNKKHKCLTKLKSIIKNSPYLSTDLEEFNDEL